jgi:ABC-2 type transport system permease protein
MKNAILLAKKDFFSYFHSWMGVLAFAFFLLVAGLFFTLLVVSYAKISMEVSRNALENVRGLNVTRFVFSSFFLNLATVLIFIVPILSMRAFAEERKQETLELLYTYPFSDVEIVWGKFLGMIWFFELLILPVAVYVGIIHSWGLELDWGPIVMGFIGFWLLGNAYLAVGLFISSVSENQVVSAVVTFGCLLIFWILDWVTNVTNGFWARFFGALSPIDHYREFALGVLDLSNVAYFILFYLYFLFLALRAVETRQWKG